MNWCWSTKMNRRQTLRLKKLQYSKKYRSVFHWISFIRVSIGHEVTTKYNKRIIYGTKIYTLIKTKYLMVLRLPIHSKTKAKSLTYENKYKMCQFFFGLNMFDGF